MNVNDLLLTAAMESGFTPSRGIPTMPDATRAYVESWMKTVDRGCGHPAEVRFTSIPARSVLCPACAISTGILDRALLCGRCRAPVDPSAGDYAAVFAATEPVGVIVFIAMCAMCSKEME